VGLILYLSHIEMLGFAVMSDRVAKG